MISYGYFDNNVRYGFAEGGCESGKQGIKHYNHVINARDWMLHMVPHK